MKNSMKKNTVLVLALAFAASPLVAIGQTDSGDQAKSKTSSDQAMDSSAKSKTGKDAAAKEDADTASAADSDIFIDEQDKTDLLAGNMIGSYVNDASGNSLGSVTNVLIDENQQVRALVVGVGGFLGIGAKAVAVDIDKIQQSRGDDGSLELVLSATKEQLQNAPTFKTLLQQKAEQKAQERGQQAQQQMQQKESGESDGAATSGGDGSGSDGGSTN